MSAAAFVPAISTLFQEFVATTGTGTFRTYNSSGGLVDFQTVMVANNPVMPWVSCNSAQQVDYSISTGSVYMGVYAWKPNLVL